MVAAVVVDVDCYANGTCCHYEFGKILAFWVAFTNRRGEAENGEVFIVCSTFEFSGADIKSFVGGAAGVFVDII